MVSEILIVHKMIDIKTFVLLIIASILTTVVLDFYGPFPIRVLMFFWMFHLLANIIFKILYDEKIKILLYKEQLIALILLFPLFMIIKINPILYTIAVFGLTDMIIILKEHIEEKLSKPYDIKYQMDQAR